jgi:tetratricopeptide (TPR) repeat protein
MSHIVCPHCQTANRLTRVTCVHCDRDISMIRVIANKAKHHFNAALEHAERQRWSEATTELHNCLDLDANHVNAHVVMGTCLAKLDRHEEARQAWERALAVDSRFSKAHDYLQRVEEVPQARRYYRNLCRVTMLMVGVLLLVAWKMWLDWRPDAAEQALTEANRAFRANEFAGSAEALQRLFEENPDSDTLAAGQALFEALHSVIDLEKGRIQLAEDDDDWRRGLDACNRLLALNPPEADQRQALRKQAEFAANLLHEVEALVARLEEGEMDPASVLAQIEGLADEMPTQSLRERFQEADRRIEDVVAQRREEDFERALAAALEDSSSETPLERLLTLNALRADWPDRQPLTDAMARVAADIAREVQTRWDRLQIDATPGRLGNFAEQTREIVALAEVESAWPASVADSLATLTQAVASAESAIPRAAFVEQRRAVESLLASEQWTDALAALDAIPQENLTEDEEGWIDETRERHARSGFESDFVRAQTLAEGENWDKALETLDGLSLARATDEERSQIDSLRMEISESRDRAHMLEAVALLNRWTRPEHDRAFERGTIDDALAREVVDNFETVIDAVPDTQYSRSFRTRHVLFYAARSWEHLGEPERARPLYQRLLSEFANHPQADLAREGLARIDDEAAGTGPE